jgi:hypothetical protein
MRMSITPIFVGVQMLLAVWGYAGGQEQGAGAVIKQNTDDSAFSAAPRIMPPCFRGAPQHFNQQTGGAVFLVKADTQGCNVPWHWHISGEQITVVSGEVQVTMKGAATIILHAGGYAYMPPHHIHSFACSGPCVHFVQSDGPYDIHFVDAEGHEISMAQALGQSNKE